MSTKHEEIIFFNTGRFLCWILILHCSMWKCFDKWSLYSNTYSQSGGEHKSVSIKAQYLHEHHQAKDRSSPEPLSSWSWILVLLFSSTVILVQPYLNIRPLFYYQNKSELHTASWLQQGRQAENSLQRISWCWLYSPKRPE